MKFFTTMPSVIKPFYKMESELARTAFNQKNYRECWSHLERAHILGQSYPYEHTAVHWKMLRFGIKLKNTKEIIGQIPRLLVGGVKSFVGVIPLGNTGGADVPPLRPMKIPADLQAIINKTHTS